MIEIRKYDLDPITQIGEVAGICWGADLTNKERSFKRGIECIDNNHGRVMEFTDIQIVIDAYSARVIRELYTHVVGTSRLQESTRYVDCSNFEYYTPKGIEKNEEANKIYDEFMQTAKDTYTALIGLGCKKEDVAGVLPLNSNSKMVLKINLRALIHLFELRLCSRAYEEFRILMNDIRRELSKLSDEWKIICDTYFKPKCINMGYCDERYSCGLRPKKEVVKEQIKLIK